MLSISPQGVRYSMMEGSGTLEEQLEAIQIKANEIRAHKKDLRDIEELGARLEERLILDNRFTEHSTVSFGFEHYLYNSASFLNYSRIKIIVLILHSLSLYVTTTKR